MLQLPVPRASALALVAVLGLSACSTADQSSHHRRSPWPDNGGRPRSGYPGDARSTAEYRRVPADADRYAERLDERLDLSVTQERSVERVLRERAHDLLRRTPPRDHDHVYPFPRSERNPSVRRWWDGTDLAVSRVLTPRQREEHRDFLHGRDRYDWNDQNDERYEGRRYNDRGNGRGHERHDRDDDRDDKRAEDRDGDRPSVRVAQPARRTHERARRGDDD